VYTLICHLAICVTINYFCGISYRRYVFTLRFPEDESCRIALGNLRSEVITLRNEAPEKDKILLSLVERLKSIKAKLSAQAEAHEAEVQEIKKKVVEATENFNVEVVKHEICEIERSRAQKNVDELRAAKEKCYEISMNALKI
jgi:hypothetical protein